MNKIVSFLVTLFLWVLLVVLQCITISYQGGFPNALEQPELYYSIWGVDLYLIVLFYTHYYVFAPLMIRRRLFKTYGLLTFATMILGFLVPIILFTFLGWTMPDVREGQMPIDLIGVIGSLFIASLALALRSVREWMSFEPKKKEMKANLDRIDELKAQAVVLKNQILEQKTEKTALEKRITDLEAKIDAYRDLYGLLAEDELDNN